MSKFNKGKKKRNLFIEESEACYREIAIDNIQLNDNDHLIIGDFLRDNTKKYEIGFGIINPDNRMVNMVKNFDLHENRDLAVFIYNCNINLINIIGKDIILKNRNNEIIWAGKVRTIPNRNLVFSEHNTGECYICDRVINKDTIENKKTEAIATISGEDKIYGILNINSKNIIKEDINIIDVDYKSEKKIATELKHYIGNRAREITLKIIDNIIDEYLVEIKNIIKTNKDLDKYIKITILEDNTIISINQVNNIETIIKIKKENISLERILSFIMV